MGTNSQHRADPAIDPGKRRHRGAGHLHQPFPAARVCDVGDRERLGFERLDGARRVARCQVRTCLYRGWGPVREAPHRAGAGRVPFAPGRPSPSGLTGGREACVWRRLPPDGGTQSNRRVRSPSAEVGVRPRECQESLA